MSPIRRTPAARRRRLWPVVIVVLGVVAAPPPVATAIPADELWSSTAESFAPGDFHTAPYLGNGRIGTVLPPSGGGYHDYGDAARTSFPLQQSRYTGTYLAGFYAQAALSPEYLRSPQYTQVIAALPAWTGLAVEVDGHRYDADVDPATVHDYRQTLDYRTATVTTRADWTPDPEHRLRLRYDTFVSRDRPDLAVQKLTVTPERPGELAVVDRIDGAAARRVVPVTTTADPSSGRTVSGVRAEGTSDTAFVVSSVDSPPQAAGTALPGADGIRYLLPVTGNDSYTFTAYTGISSTDYGSDPLAAATAAAESGRAQGFDATHSAHAAQWDRLWQPAIETPGRTDYTRWIRAALYSVLASVRAGERWSVQPAGLSSDDYGGMTFWDAETWIFPTLLALYPDLARTVVDFRAAALPAARANARGYGLPGALYPWDDGPAQRCASPIGCGLTEEHLHNEIALAQWQYYLATGDSDWLRTRGAPVITAIADYLTARIGPKMPDGAYHFAPAAGSDEYVTFSVDNALTNGGVRNTMDIAARAAGLSGLPVDPRWADIAAHMAMPPDIAPGVPAEYLGYTGAPIKQADTVLLSYPFTYAAPGYSPAATTRYYFDRTDPDGPNMSNSVGAILSARYDPCNTQYYLDRSVQPYAREPYGFQAEARGDRSGANAQGQSAWIFVTGAAGFLQGLLYAPLGLRWTESGPSIDPMLPGGFPDGLTMRGLAIGATRTTVHITPANTTLTLTSGDPITLQTPGGPVELVPGQPLSIPTRAAC
ncbi:glycoside hydrolase family 65 protein [Nocardia elegans]|uniref:Glycoside hydrolase family 65 protein n=1 Tax=Nocardia elegans TaxID=300029 RepID=A0ABW6TF95_9NOCA|nr:glycoside hydrolase family 65 protein [Nocardia elegans]MBF6447972.1 glycoside hydrolase family 65 protein [Nocardia elegans]